MFWRKFWENVGYKPRFPQTDRLPVPQYNPDRWIAGSRIETAWPGIIYQTTRVRFRWVDMLKLLLSRRVVVIIYSRADAHVNEVVAFPAWYVEAPFKTKPITEEHP